MKVININGTEINFESAVVLMDDEIRESICGTVDTEQEFFTAYEKAHAEKNTHPNATIFWKNTICHGLHCLLLLMNGFSMKNTEKC